MKSLLLRVLSAITLTATSVLVTIKAPDLHHKYLRNEAGPASVMLLGKQGGGSGFHVEAPSGKTYILTNAHVCGLAVKGRIKVVSAAKNITTTRKVLQVYDSHDLCLVEPIEGIDGLEVATSSNISDTIYVAGNPRLVPFSINKGEVIDRKIIEIVDSVNISGDECDGKYIQLDGFAAMMYGFDSVCLKERDSIEANVISYAGNSGSAVVNGYGNVVAVLFAGDTSMPTDAYLVPLDFIQDFLRNK